MNDLYRYRPLTDTNSKLWNKLRVDGDVKPVEPETLYELNTKPSPGGGHCVLWKPVRAVRIGDNE